MFFFFNDTATTEIYTLSLHDALPISVLRRNGRAGLAQAMRRAMRKPSLLAPIAEAVAEAVAARPGADRKSTRLNSSHANISYAVFCLKKNTSTNVMPSVSCHVSLDPR